MFITLQSSSVFWHILYDLLKANPQETSISPSLIIFAVSSGIGPGTRSLGDTLP